MFHKNLDEWYLVNINGEYFAEMYKKTPYHDRPTKSLFRDFNGKVMSLGKDEKFATFWVNNKNKIDRLC